MHGATKVGRLTSGGWSVAFGKQIGMGYVRPDLAAPGTRLEVKMLGQALAGRGGRGQPVRSEERADPAGRVTGFRRASRGPAGWGLSAPTPASRSQRKRLRFQAAPLRPGRPARAAPAPSRGRAHRVTSRAAYPSPVPHHKAKTTALQAPTQGRPRPFAPCFVERYSRVENRRCRGPGAQPPGTPATTCTVTAA